MALKERISDENALIHRVDERIAECTTSVRDRVGALEGEFKKHRLRQRIAYYGSTILFLTVFVGGQLGLFVPVSDEVLSLAVLFIPVFLIVALIWWVSGVQVIRHFHAAVDAALYEKVFDLLGVQGRLIPQAVPKDIWMYLKQFNFHTEMGRTLEQLNRSELITSPYNRTRIDDAWDIAIGNSNLYMCELNVKYESGSGKNRQVITLFNGLFASFALDKKLEGKTFITTDKDIAGYGDSFFWHRGEAGVRKTELEWNDFEKLLRVSTNNEVEARYILTTDYMHDLYKWWKEQKAAIRISFIENRMYILFPNGKIRFDRTIDEISDEEIREYLLTIAKPLMHVVHLIEDVRL